MTFGARALQGWGRRSIIGTKVREIDKRGFGDILFTYEETGIGPLGV